MIVIGLDSSSSLQLLLWAEWCSRLPIRAMRAWRTPFNIRLRGLQIENSQNSSYLETLFRNSTGSEWLLNEHVSSWTGHPHVLSTMNLHQVTITKGYVTAFRASFGTIFLKEKNSRVQFDLNQKTPLIAKNDISAQRNMRWTCTILCVSTRYRETYDHWYL